MVALPLPLLLLPIPAYGLQLQLDVFQAGWPGNNCAYGKLLPELYVLGPMSAATTSVWEDMKKSGAISSPHGGIQKEWHFFYNHAGMPLEEQREEWVSELLPCPNEPLVMVDFSWTNLNTIPIPEDIHLGLHRDKRVSKHWDTAHVIKQFHLEATGKEPYMMVMLRDPLVRIHSEYYQDQQMGSSLTGEQASRSFATDFALDVRLLQRDPPLITENFWNSFTGRGVEEYRKHFNASSFIFLPIQEYGHDPRGLSTKLLPKLGLEVKPWEKASHANGHAQKPPLDKELPPGSRTRLEFEAFMKPEVDRLVTVLTEMHEDGAWLVGYNGVAGDSDDVRRWLQGSW